MTEDDSHPQTLTVVAFVKAHYGSVNIGDALHDGQPQATAHFTATQNPVEALPDLLPLFRRQSRSLTVTDIAT